MARYLLGLKVNPSISPGGEERGAEVANALACTEYLSIALHATASRPNFPTTPHTEPARTCNLVVCRPSRPAGTNARGGVGGKKELLSGGPFEFGRSFELPQLVSLLMSLLDFFLAFNNTLIDSTEDSTVVTSAPAGRRRRSRSSRCTRCCP